MASEVKVEKKVKKDNQETWETTHKERAEVSFYLQDETGKILVNPERAEYNLPQAFWGELRPPALLSCIASGFLDQMAVERN